MSTAVVGPGRDSTSSGEQSGRDPAFDAFFDRWYAPLVGLARRSIDPRAVTGASLATAEELAVDALARLRHRLDADESENVAAAVATIADGAVDRLVGHPGSVPLHYEILGPDVDFDGELPLAELHRAISGMRRRDRRVGVLALACGLSPSQVATLTLDPLDDVLERVARVCTRLADGRRIGLTDDLLADG